MQKERWYLSKQNGEHGSADRPKWKKAATRSRKEKEAAG
jgi:hypothetical protein